MAREENNSIMTPANRVREMATQDGAVLLDIEQGLCFGLNPVGAKIWKMAKDGHSVDEIVDCLAQEFRLPRAQVVEDVSDFLKQLDKTKLISEQPPPSARHGLFSRLLARNRTA